MAKRRELDVSAAKTTRVFISYSRKDAEFVGRLKAALNEKNYDTFIDTEEISGGEEWKKRLDQLILAADAVVFIISPDSVSSPICDWETKRALELGKRLIPALWRAIGDVQPPAQLRERNYIFFDAPERFEAALNQICNACDVDIGWVREHTRLVELSTRWEALGRKRDLLLRGDEIAAAEEWRKNRTPRAPEVPETLVAFLSASRSEEKRVARQRRSLITLVVVAVLAVFAGGAGWLTQGVWSPILRDYVHYGRYAVAQGALPAHRLPDGAYQDCDRDPFCPEMVVIPTGQFNMGSPDTEPNRSDNEGPQHAVAVARFAASKYLITFADWNACLADGGCRNGVNDTIHPDRRGWKGDDLPVSSVSWDDAQSYVKWMSRKTGQTYRLLSEAEWEYAARGATSLDAPHKIYPWGDELGSYNANCNGCGSKWDNKQTSPVESFKPNTFGLYDMAGNVFQWVEDCYHDNYAGAPHAGYPAWSDEICSVRVLRGGSWGINPPYLRSAARNTNAPDGRDEGQGFRVARTLSLR